MVIITYIGVLIVTFIMCVVIFKTTDSNLPEK